MCKQEGGNTEPWEVLGLAWLVINEFTITNNGQEVRKVNGWEHSIMTPMCRDVMIETYYFV